MHRSSAVVLCLLAGGVAAQQNIRYLQDNLPSGPGNAFPWGSAHIRYQTIFDAALLGNVPAFVNDVIVTGSAADTTPREVFYEDIEILFGNTSVTHAGLTQSWSTNNPGPARVYRGPLRAVFERGAWRGIGLPWAFLYVPQASAPNLCVEVIVWRVRGQTGPSNFFFPAAGSMIQRAYYYDWATQQSAAPNRDASGSKFGLLLDDGNQVLLGEGCFSSTNRRLAITTPPNGWPRRGQPYALGLTGGAPQRPTFLALGRSDTTSGSISLPLALAPFGGGSCQLWSEPLALVVAVSDASGNATANLAFPSDPMLSLGRLFATWAQLDQGANPMGFGWSNYVKLILDR